MRDERARKGQQTRLDYAHISEDLFLLSDRLKIPVIAAAQANRAAMVKGEDEKVGVPKIEHLAESDAVAQNSSKVISIKNSDGILEMNVLKNRDGAKGFSLTYRWDIDSGTFTYIPNSETDQAGAEKARKEFKDKADRF